MDEVWIDALGGGVAAIATNLFTHPLDTIKCRMQTDPKAYSRMTTTTLYILKNEKFLGFYKGIFANNLASVPINSMQFMIYGSAKRYIKEHKYITNKNLNYFVSGCIAGTCTLPLIVPLEMIKCNQQVNFQGKTKKENRFVKKTQHIYRKAGLKGFTRGFFAAANRDVLTTGLYFNIYYTIKHWYKTTYAKPLGSIGEVAAGGFTGLIIWIFQYPFDTVKTIIQTAPLKDPCLSQMQVIRTLVKDGGISQFYRGASPALLLSVMFTALCFFFFEIFRKILKKRQQLTH